MRLPPTGARNAAFDKLHTELAVATEKFEHQGDGGRLGVFQAIAAVFDYCTSRGIPPAALEPLMAITAAIVDVERGTSSPIFEPTRSATGGSPPTPAMQLARQGHLAVITECCVRHCKADGMRPYLKPATIMAAKMVNTSKWPITVTATEMREVRERVRRCRDPKSPDRIAFDIQTSSDVLKNMPLTWAKRLLNHEWVIMPCDENSA